MTSSQQRQLSKLIRSHKKSHIYNMYIYIYVYILYGYVFETQTKNFNHYGHLNVTFKVGVVLSRIAWNNGYHTCKLLRSSGEIY